MEMTEKGESLLPISTHTSDLPSSSSDHDVLQLHVKTFVPAWGGLRGVALLGPQFHHIIMAQQGFSPFRFVGYLLGATGLSIFFFMFGILSTCVMHRQLSHEPGQLFSHVRPCLINRQFRLYPGICFMVITTASAFYLIRGPDDFRSGLPEMMARTLLHITNFDPFPIGKAQNPWSHTWAIALQEQAYLVWLFVFPVYTRYPKARQPIFSMMAVLAVGLLLGRLCHTVGYIRSPIYSPQGAGNHGWKIIVGMLTPLVRLPKWIMTSKALYLGLTCLLLCVLSTASLGFLLGNMERYYDLTLVLSSATAAYTILLGSFNGNGFLESKPVRWSGRISLAWYLYQVPILIISRWPDYNRHAARDTLLALCAGVFSTLYVQEPVQNWWKARQLARRRT